MFDCGTAGPLRVLWLHAIKAFDKPGAQGSGIRGGGGGGDGMKLTVWAPHWTLECHWS